MEESESRVWQRVAGKPPMALEALFRLSQEQAAALEKLGATSSGQRRCVLRRLSAQAAFAARVVAGAMVLEGDCPQRAAMPCPEGGTRRTLALAYRRSRTLWEAYRTRAASGEYSQAFQQLTTQETQSSTQLLALLGTP